MIDLDALERWARNTKEKPDDLPRDVLALIQRLREAEASKRELKAWADVAVDDLRARIVQLERVREAAQRLADSGVVRGPGSIVRVDGDLALDLGAALAALEPSAPSSRFSGAKENVSPLAENRD